jgi:hypothetical protein
MLIAALADVEWRLSRRNMLARGGFAGQQPVPVVSTPDKGSAEPVVTQPRGPPCVHRRSGR